MDAERWKRTRRALAEALRLPPGERQAYVEGTFPEDAGLRGEVLSLLASEPDSGDFLEPPFSAALDGYEGEPGEDTRPGQRIGPYEIVRPIASGGMGSVFLAERRDGQFEQTVAIKLIRAGMATGPILRRFRQERQVLASLEHPGIARLIGGDVHTDGRPYIVMEYVEGERIDSYCERRALGLDGRLVLFSRICAAVHHAHQRLVVHRDLKPANILVTGEGEPKLLDFGLAKVLAPEGRSRTYDATAERDRLLTPQYAAPEQLLGRDVTTGTDVYALGVLLYELLAGCRPYELDGQPWGRVERLVCVEDPERPSRALARRGGPRAGRPLAGDLDTIVMVALRKDPARRYGSVERLAEDVQRHRTGLPITTRPDTAAYRLAKFLRRNRRLAGTVVLAFLLLVAGTVGILQQARRAARERADVLRLSAFQDLEDLVRAADGLWPAHPRHVPAYREWIVAARELVGQRPRHQGKVLDLEARLEHRSTAGRAEASEERWWHGQLRKLIAELDRFADPGAGLLSALGASSEHGWSVPRRLEHALWMEEEFAPGGGMLSRWEAALPAIRGAYPGLSLEPQIGLVPLGPDPATGLWEFADLQTGTAPERDARGVLALTEESGLVLVLLPADSFLMGAQSDDPDGPNYSVHAREEEAPPHGVTLSPFFLSKYEMNQAQWQRATGHNPSHHQPPDAFAPNLMHPVESVDWFQSVRVCEWSGATLPSEARWEYGARGGTTTPWWSGPVRESLAHGLVVNLADEAAHRFGVSWPSLEVGIDDGWVAHAPVHSGTANPFGLVFVQGNVWEWCLDAYSNSFYGQSPPVDPLCEDLSFSRTYHETRVYRPVRGGAFDCTADMVRCSVRDGRNPESVGAHIGLRPARSLDRAPDDAR